MTTYNRQPASHNWVGFFGGSAGPTGGPKPADHVRIERFSEENP